MRRATTLLNIIRDRGNNGLPIKDAYRMLYQKELYLMAYAKLYSNAGAMTPGTSDDTIDGMSILRIEELIKQIKDERYRWSPARRVYVQKRDKSKLRPLGMPGWNDKLLQEVIRSILEAYYEPKFSDASHGFRHGRGCHTALERVKEKGKGTKWFVEGDIRSCFDKIDFSVLLNILKKDFKDNRFILLIRRMLDAGYMEGKVFNKTYSGVPQGGIASPILTNLMLNELDKYIEDTLIPEFDKGTERKHNNAYHRLKNRQRRAQKEGRKKEANKYRKASLKLPSRIPDDPGHKRMWYVRYADDWLVGVIGPKSDADTLRIKIATYLSENLKLELNEEKTLVTHARTARARFLGYHIHVLHDDGKHNQGKRTINGKIGLTIPKKVINTYCSKYMCKGKPIHRTNYLSDEPFSIISLYQAEYRGIVQFYKMAFNLHKLNRLKHTMEVSLAKTLAAKYKTSCQKIYKKYQTSIDTPHGKRKVLQVIYTTKKEKTIRGTLRGYSISMGKKGQAE